MTATTPLTRRSGTHHGGGGDWKETLGRVGLVGKGVLYSSIGLLAIQLALGSTGGPEADQQGAIEWVAQQPFGRFLLVLLTISLFALAAWRLLDAAVGDPVEGGEASDRAKFAVKGLVYLSLAIGAVSTTIDTWEGTASSSGGDSTQETTAAVLGWPGGRWIVAIAGLALIAYAIHTFKAHVIDERFLRRLDVGGDSWIDTAGRWGYAARSVVYVVIGWFLFQSGITYQAGESKGISAALHAIAGEGWGRVVLWGVAVGLLAFGVFTLAEARHRRAA
jgi:hypothetical protein